MSLYNKKPPLKNNHKFWDPKVVFVHRLDCINYEIIFLSNSGSGGETSSADTANPEGTSTKSASCDATKIDAQKLLEKLNVKPPPFEEEERELVIESWVAVEQHIAQVWP